MLNHLEMIDVKPNDPHMPTQQRSMSTTTMMMMTLNYTQSYFNCLSYSSDEYTTCVSTGHLFISVNWFPWKMKVWDKFNWPLISGTWVFMCVFTKFSSSFIFVWRVAHTSKWPPLSCFFSWLNVKGFLPPLDCQTISLLLQTKQIKWNQNERNLGCGCMTEFFAHENMR